jgi:DNA-binding NarL/FixJ family response regulator
VLIVDDHPVVRDGLRGMLAGQQDLEVVGEAADGAEAVALVGRLRPDVVLMDLRMPGLDGVGAIRRLGADSPARVLVLTTFDTDTDVVRAIEAGATGYLLKDTPREELFRAIRAAHRGESVLAPTVATKLLGHTRAPAPAGPLSARELEVLRLVARGATNREVGATLFISEATVKTHLLHMFEKLGVSDRTAAVTAALERGLLRPGQ